jgi:hypothetical protein
MTIPLDTWTNSRDGSAAGSPSVRRWSQRGGAVGDLARRLAVLEKRERRASGTGMLTELRYRMLGPMGANAVGLYRAMTGSR